jgi:transcriptional regulator with XRE-family HTH domain
MSAARPAHVQYTEHMLGEAIRHRRELLGLSIREAARRIGISTGYLVELEHGRNPTTGRAPIPSATVLAGIGRALEIDVVALLDLAGATPRRSAHVLLVQMGGGRRSARAAARRAVAGTVDTWLEVARRGDPARALGAIVGAVPVDPAGPDRRLGLVFGPSPALLGTTRSRDAVLASERTWEDDVAAACRAAAGTEPDANVCVYREADLRAAAGDPLLTAIELVRAHPRVAAQDREGRVTTGPAAIQAVLGAVRPAAVDPGTWASLATAAAAGLHRATGTA